MTQAKTQQTTSIQTFAATLSEGSDHRLNARVTLVEEVGLGFYGFVRFSRVPSGTERPNLEDVCQGLGWGLGRKFTFHYHPPPLPTEKKSSITF